MNYQDEKFMFIMDKITKPICDALTFLEELQETDKMPHELNLKMYDWDNKLRDTLKEIMKKREEIIIEKYNIQYVWVLDIIPNDKKEPSKSQIYCLEKEFDNEKAWDFLQKQDSTNSYYLNLQECFNSQEELFKAYEDSKNSWFKDKPARILSYKNKKYYFHPNRRNFMTDKEDSIYINNRIKDKEKN